MRENNLRQDDLNLDGLKLYQYTDGYHFTSDSVILANFVNAKHSDNCLEIGTGSGIIATLVNYKCKPKEITCFEIQQKYCDLAQKNFDYNNMQNITVICDKIQNHKNYIAKPFDVIFCNPPYYKNDVCKKSENEEIAMCKHEQFLPLGELVQSVSETLKFGGKFYFVYPAHRIDEVFETLAKHNIQVKRMFFVQPKHNKEPNTVVYECTKGGKNGVRILPTLITNNASGDYVQTIQKLYK